MAHRPPLSIVMPVLDAMPWLDEAVADILAQSFADFEFVILDDGSSDGSRKRLREWAARDRRIRLIEGSSRAGPAASSQRLVEEARAPLVARMDADDRAAPERIARQMAAFAGRPDAILVGALAAVIDGRGRRLRDPDLGRLVRPSLFPPFGHSSILFRKAAFERAGGYRPAAAKWEDVDLYLRMSREGPILVVVEELASIRLTMRSSRLSDGGDALDRAMHMMRRGASAFARGEDHATAAERAAADRRLDPAAFVASGAVPLWSGSRPRAFTRLLRRGALAADRTTLQALAWTACAAAAPSGLRALLRLRLRIANRRARRVLAGRGVVEWRPPRPAPPR